MNSPFLQEMSSSIDQSIGQTPDFVGQLFRRILARNPSAEERKVIAAIAERPSSVADEAPDRPWRYGAVSLDAAGRVREFRAFRVFTGSAWQAASMLPDAKEGMASVTAAGGSPGDGLENAVSRRWIAPRDMTVRVTSVLVQQRNQYAQRFQWTNGVRGSLVASRGGLIGQWLIDGPAKGSKIVEMDESKAVANVESIRLKAGDTLDFVVDSRGDPEQDSFTWKIKIQDAQGADAWDSEQDFKGPQVRPLTSRARAAQVLLMSNEFAFVD
jgi:hypothetical protein